jgi:hypothetical protein
VIFSAALDRAAAIGLSTVSRTNERAAAARLPAGSTRTLFMIRI